MRLLPPQGFGPSSSCIVCIEKYLKLKYTVSIPERISICFIDQRRMESLGNSDVSIVKPASKRLLG